MATAWSLIGPRVLDQKFVTVKFCGSFSCKMDSFIPKWTVNYIVITVNYSVILQPN